MKKIFVGLLTAMILSTMCFPVNTFAEPLERNINIVDSEYENILNSINAEFGLDIGYGSVDSEKISLDQYEALTRKVAKQQRELLDYIESNKNTNNKFKDSKNLIQARITKTRTSGVWGYESTFKITATYDVNGNQVSNISKLSLSIVSSTAKLISTSSPSITKIDGGRTYGVEYIADIMLSGIQFKDISLYTEFYYSS